MLTRRVRRMILYGVPAVVTVGWLLYVLASDQWDRVFFHWRSSITMIFGSFVAGSTPQGGGAVAFPVFTKVLQVPADVTRTFSLSIQMVGMGTAATAILLSGKPIEARVVLAGGFSGVAGFLFGLLAVADSATPFWKSTIPEPYVKVTFTIMLAALAYIVYLALDEGACGEQEMPHWNRRIWLGIIGAGFFGGLISALIGSGVDVFIFLFVVILAGLHPRVGVPTSVLSMALISTAGFIVLGLVDGQLNIGIDAAGDVISVAGQSVGPLPGQQFDVFGMWLAAVPIVIWGAPLGTAFVHMLTERRLILFLAGMAAAEVISTAIFLEPLRTDRSLLTYAVVGLAAAIVGITLLDRHKADLLDIPEEKRHLVERSMADKSS